MTDFELQQAKRKLAEQMRKAREESGNPTDEQRRQYKKLLCVSMITSVIAYGWYKGETAKELLDRELNHKHRSYLEEYVNIFGYDEVLALVRGQLDDIQDIERDVFTDGEGVSYNSIIWKNKEV